MQYGITSKTIGICICAGLLFCNCSAKRERSKDWIRTFCDLAFLLNCYGEDHQRLPYNSRGAEYALFEFSQYIWNDPHSGFYRAEMESKWGADYVPFCLDWEKRKVIDSRVDYWNEDGLEFNVQLPPCVLLVRRFQPGQPNVLLLIGSDLNVYEVFLPVDLEPSQKASTYLGMSLVELSNRYITRVVMRIGYLDPDVKLMDH